MWKGGEQKRRYVINYVKGKSQKSETFYTKMPLGGVEPPSRPFQRRALAVELQRQEKKPAIAGCVEWKKSKSARWNSSFSKLIYNISPIIHYEISPQSLYLHL